MDYMEKYRQWLEDDYFDKDTKKELRALQDEKEIEDRFYKDLEFGTAGLRGIIGAGSNRMNIYTVTKATQGLANYIIKQGQRRGAQGVVIAYDSRNQSPEFAKAAALVLNANGIITYLFTELQPVPILSFAVRYLDCTAGIMITASHNPPEYNGYKVYWDDGAQVVPPHDTGIIQEVNQIESYRQIKKVSEDEAGSLHRKIGEEILREYIQEILKQSVHPELVRKMTKNVNIVYTPLHGTGNKPVRRVLKELGFQNVWIVPQQELPDPQFPTVAVPNPEDPKAFTLAYPIAKGKKADVIIGTDPDADRMGIAVPNLKGEYITLTGNVIGVLLTEYLLSQKEKNNTLPSNGVIIKTIVSTEMVRAIADEYGMEVFEVLTGFKYIGEKIKEFEKDKSNSFIFGFEESYGYLAGTHARDKDAVVASMLISELTAHYRSEGMTLWEGLQALYKKYGYYMEKTVSITLKGKSGLERIQRIMKSLRMDPPKTFHSSKVKIYRDYQEGKIIDEYHDEPCSTELPQSNVLYYTLEDQSWICIRPSGTEPKIKFYVGVKGETEEDAKERLKLLSESVGETIKLIH